LGGYTLLVDPSPRCWAAGPIPVLVSAVLLLLAVRVSGERPGVTSAEHAEIKRLKAQDRGLVEPGAYRGVEIRALSGR